MNIKNELGYMWYFLIVALVAVALLFIKIPYSPNKTGTAGGDCYYNPPLSSDSFTDDGVQYDLIKKGAPIISVQVLLHLEKTKMVNVNGKLRRVGRTEAEANISNWSVSDETERPKWHDVRFVDVSDDYKMGIPGTSFIDIYIKRGTPIPNDILTFCARNTAEWRGFLSDNNNKSFPPKEIDASTITPWVCDPSSIPGSQAACLKFLNEEAPRDKIYYLYAYDTNFMAPVDYVKRTNQMPHATITIDSVAYTIVFYGWESKHLRLETTDPVTGQEIGFRYANPERLKVPEDPYKFLNKTETATSSLQLKAFTPFQIPPSGWWTPECKPAIYLYPTQNSLVSVNLDPKGLINYVNPKFNLKQGWIVNATPDGTMELNGQLGKTYPYLYYESKLEDRFINPPKEGFVIQKQNLSTFYLNLLPQLGLNQKETQDYIEYWQKYLPSSEYYFIGLLPSKEVDLLEPLTMNPEPQSILRVRFYYQLLSQAEAEKLQKSLPTHKLPLTKFERKGFTVVEWGGLVKRDPNHPFTCSM